MSSYKVYDIKIVIRSPDRALVVRVCVYIPWCAVANESVAKHSLVSRTQHKVS